jgi:hypothetical protein
VISGFGLSAFVFSTIAHIAFPGDTSSFLSLLAWGTAIPMIVGFFFVRPIPLPPSEPLHTLEHGEPAFSGLNSHTPLLSDSEEEETSRGSDVELSSPGGAALTHRRNRSRNAARLSNQEESVDISGKALWLSVDFWILFSILALRKSPI